MFCVREDETLFPEGPETLECGECGKMNPVPFEVEEVTQERAEEICFGRGIKLEDLLT